MPIDIHGLQKRFESIPDLDNPSIMESVKAFRSTLQGRKKELLAPFGLDDLDKFKDNPAAFKDSVAAAMDSFKEKKMQDSTYRKLYEDCRCLVTFTTRPEGAAAAGSHLNVNGETLCPWCICVKHPDNEKWWTKYQTTALAFIYTKDDACCIVLSIRDALETLENRFAFSQVEGIENTGLNGKPEEQRKVLERLYRKSGLSDSRMGDILRPVLGSMRERLEKTILNESLFAAIKERHPKRVKECLSKGADANALDEMGWHPLYWATDMGLAWACKMLIKAGADVNAGDNDDLQSPLNRAAKMGKTALCRLFIKAGADVDFRDHYGLTPLHRAATQCHFDICKMLIESGAEVDARDDAGWTPLYSAADKRNNGAVCKLLVDAGADVNAHNKVGWTPLHKAAWEGVLENCKVLLDAGASVDAVNRHGDTPLSFACSSNRKELVEMMMNARGEREGVAPAILLPVSP